MSKCLPSDKGNPYFQARDMQFGELKRTGVSVQNHLKIDILLYAFYPLAPWSHPKDQITVMS